MSDIVAEARNWASPQSDEPADGLILELVDEIERLRDIVRDFAKESTYSDALISNLLDPEGSDHAG